MATIISLAALLVSAVSSLSFDILQDKKILVVGGSGRVGGSVVTNLVQRNIGSVVVGGTSVNRFIASQQRWLQLFPEHADRLQAIEFVAIDREQADSVCKVLTKMNFDAVVHTAGPFQGKVLAPNGILDACIQANVPYIDVCDDYCTASAAKTKYSAQAKVPCIISTGCWPGVSSLMAKQLVETILKAYPSLSPSDLNVRFSFFTAGSGGAGVTLLVATFLILAEKALMVKNGRRVEVEAMNDYVAADFGPTIGERQVAPLNLLETASIHDNLGVGSTSSLFGTAPKFWNTLLGLMAKLPQSMLADEDLMRKLSIFSMPIVRIVDSFAGATNAMRCDVTAPNVEPSVRVTAVYGHENLEPCVGECVVAFVCASLSGMVPAGVWFPEEAIRGGSDAASVLKLASIGAHTTTVQGTDIEIDKRAVWGRD
ncbi:hypothetical protein MPSEU_000197400 [Mayamaea pseudoterrestris]|nr:hypothetical protein MPSEU_000197400 [Mayamaea pseudoterrestris]